jgi:UDPglucose--hexose-1-phosphate uridylyltransferase
MLFKSQSISTKFLDPSGKIVQRPIEIRTNPVTGRTCRLAFSRINEKETAIGILPQPPAKSNETTKCPFFT